jgi:hypothetical protein
VARGWESKSVESQIESAEASADRSRVQLTPAQIEIQRKIDGLLLSRTRVMRDIENCKDDRYRKTLEEGLTYLEGELTRLGWQAGPAAKARTAR